MSFEKLSAGMKLSEYFIDSTEFQRPRFQEAAMERSMVIRQSEIAKIVSKYALFGYNLSAYGDFTDTDIPPLEELELFDFREEQIAEARHVMAQKYNQEPELFDPIIVTRGIKEKETSGLDFRSFSEYESSLTLVFSYPIRGLPYRDYFYRSPHLLPDVKLKIGDEIFDTAESMDVDTYRELSGRRISYNRAISPSKRDFDRNYWTALTAYPPATDGKICIDGIKYTWTYPDRLSPKVKFRPSVTLAKASSA